MAVNSISFGSPHVRCAPMGARRTCGDPTCTEVRETTPRSLFFFGFHRPLSNFNTRYNKTWGTVMGKHTDTPGMSRSAIPALAGAGIQAYVQHRPR